MRYSAKTDIGNKKENNEDSFLALVNDEIVNIFAVADGMGGHDFGEEASEIAISYIRDNSTIDSEITDVKEYISNIFNEINKRIYQTGIKKNTSIGMGTTLTLLINIKDILYIGHVGDSRLYIINNEITQITKDHSYVEELIDKGMITKKEAKNHPKKHIITRALGTLEEVESDIIEHQLKSNDVILLCSDGLTNMIDDEEIKKIVLSSKTIDEANDNLIKLAKDRGGYDNITIVIIKNN